MKQKNYYKILGVDEKADAASIKSAYRTLAKQFHPDRNQGDTAAEARFKEISEAYEVLGNAEKRGRYDELRRYSSGGARGSMSYEDFMSRFGGYSDTQSREFTWGFGDGNLGDIFSTLFGAGRRSQGGGMHFSFDGGDEAHGARTRGQAPGGGHARGGRAPQGFQGGFGTPQSGGTASTDPFFRREGSDAHVTIPVNLGQALLGSTIRVRTPEGGRVQVRIPAGKQPDDVLRVRGQGFAGAPGRGDLFIHLELRLPAGLTGEQKEKAQAFIDSLGLKY